MTTYTPSHIANYILWKAKEDGVKDITPMKLLKLVYFSYAWYLATYDKPLFSEKVEAWQYGPVIPSLYHEFKRFGSCPVTSYSAAYSEDQKTIYPLINRNDDNTCNVIDAVWNCYKDRGANQLSTITHEHDSPWAKVYTPFHNAPLNDDDIKPRALMKMREILKTNKESAVE
jgi:uncharacterized phage-associated protein